jgi:outer membrane protein assembly factor BamB
MPRRGPRFARRWLVALVVLLLALGGTVAAVLLLNSPSNVSHPNLSFTVPTSPTQTTPPSTTATTTVPRRRHPPPNNFQWPVFGYDAARTRDFNGSPNLHPPLRVRWRFGGNALLEFPPVISGGTLYFEDDGATAKAVSIATGKQLWKTHLGTLSASTPAIARNAGLLIVPTLADAGNSPGDGRIAALSMKTGQVKWSMPIASGAESSPVVAGHSVYFGDQAGTVFSLDVATGHVQWTYHASGAVKGGPALVHGILYFGDYAGRAYAIRASDGHQVWAVTTSGSDFGFGSGTFYSTPAVAFGRVYMGNTDGFVYSFAAATGQVAWATSTGSYVYASPAVADIPGLGPSVFLGSYSGEFDAFNARSGAVEWSRPAGGRISGSATIVDGVVYFSCLGTHVTTGLDARTGATVFSLHDGAFTPVVADPTAIFLDGYQVIYELVPSGRRRAPATRSTRRKPRPS